MLMSFGTRLTKRLSLIHVTVIPLLGIILWNEWISYMVCSWRWGNISPSGDPGDFLRVLFVADPQIIGLVHEPKTIGPISRWDSDRYLKKTFQKAYGYHQPDVVVYLGDLLDEGSKASPDHYNIYMSRFHDMFRTEPGVKEVFIPGDNDVGGEGADFKEDWKVTAFNLHFLKDEYPPKDVVNVKFVDFFRLSISVMETVMTKVTDQLTAMAQQSIASWHVLLNHEPILQRASNDQNEILSITKGDIIFRAHSHLSKIIKCTDCREENPAGRQGRTYQGMEFDLDDYQVTHIDLQNRESVYEVTVPTCSYRMGVPSMGYGAAVFGRDGQMWYTVLWMPSRYPQLFNYLFVLVAVFILSVAMVCMRKRSTPKICC